jgi:hypothetical protein
MTALAMAQGSVSFSLICLKIPNYETIIGLSICFAHRPLFLTCFPLFSAA